MIDLAMEYTRKRRGCHEFTTYRVKRGGLQVRKMRVRAAKSMENTLKKLAAKSVHPGDMHPSTSPSSRRLEKQFLHSLRKTETLQGNSIH